MYIWILCGVGAVIAAVGFALGQSRNQMANQVKTVGLVLVVVGTIWKSIESWKPELSAPIDRGQAAIGYVMAQNLPRTLSIRSGPVLLVMPEDGIANTSSLDGFYESFARVLLNFPALNVQEATVEITKSQLESGAIPAQSLKNAIPENPAPAAIILWVGFPTLPESQDLLKSFHEKKTAIFSCDFYRTGSWKEAVQAGVIDKAFVPLADADSQNMPSAAPPDVIFKSLFQIVEK